MRRICGDGIPAFMAAAVLLVATALEARMVNTAGSGHRVDIIFNILLACIAVVSVFLIGLPAKQQPDRQPVGLLSNLLISILAFPMNIAVFRHEINWHAPLENLWGGHIGWLVCAILQILILSSLGEQLISWTRKLLALGARAAAAVGRGFSAVVRFIRSHDKGVLAIMAASTAIWMLVLASKVYRAGTYEVLADTDTLVESLLIWIAGILIGSVAYTAPLIVQKIKGAVEAIPSRKILKIVLAISILTVLSAAMPFLLKAAGLLVTVLVVPLCLAGFIIGGAAWRVRGNHQQGEQSSKPVSTINPIDLAVTLLAFLIVPLMLLNVATALSPGGQAALGQEMSVTSCLDYVTACCNVASAILQLFV